MGSDSLSATEYRKSPLSNQRAFLCLEFGSPDFDQVYHLYLPQSCFRQNEGDKACWLRYCYLKNHELAI